jgi:hypothetical protein
MVRMQGKMATRVEQAGSLERAEAEQAELAEGAIAESAGHVR